MTNEEAIKIFKEVREEVIAKETELSRQVFENLGIKAIDLAIEALEQQPCDVTDINVGDMISRQAVLDIIYFEDKWLYDANSHNADTKIVFSGLESRVKALPSVTPKAGWIPVSERLPEKNVWVLVTVDQSGNRYQEIMRRNNYIEAWTDNIGNYTDEITAWLPLPEPYKAESEK